MRKPKNSAEESEMKKEYDFSKGVRGKYAKKYQQGTNLVLLDPDIQEFFPDSKSVNEALRVIATIAKKKIKKAS